MCDGSPDCPNGEEEAFCTNTTCPGLLRCRYDDVCVHPVEICDGVNHCLMSADDESLCNVTHCPTYCICIGVVIKCRDKLPKHGQISQNATQFILREIEIPHNLNLKYFKKLRYLHIMRCHFISYIVDSQTFAGLFQIIALNIIDTNVIYLPNYIFKDLINMVEFQIRGTHIMKIYHSSFEGFSDIVNLDLSQLSILYLEEAPFRNARQLVHLNLSNNLLEKLSSKTFIGLTRIQSIDLRHNIISAIASSCLSGIKLRATLYFDHSAHCCYSDKQVLCLATDEDNSVCSRIFGTHWIETVSMAVSVVVLCLSLTNILFLLSQSKSGSYIALLVHLTISDAMPICYVLVLSIASKIYQNNYIYLNHSWVDSSLCYGLRVFVVASLIQSKIIALIIVQTQLIATKFVFKSAELLTRRNISITLLLTWLISTVIGILKCTLTSTMGMLCFPVFEFDFQNKYDIFGFVGLMLMLFLVIIAISCMYLAMIRHVYASSKRVGDSEKRRKNLDILKRRSFSFVCIEFFLWFSLLVTSICGYHFNSSKIKVVLASYLS